MAVVPNREPDMMINRGTAEEKKGVGASEKETADEKIKRKERKRER